MAPHDGGMRAYQSQFHRRWKHLNDPDVRALAWLLDSPGLLDPRAQQWAGRIATLPDDAALAASPWLDELDRAPAALQAYLAVQPFTRLGRYAEKLLAFYFEHLGILIASGLQVRASNNATIGEFDFLLRAPAGIVHWEFATKLYLLESSGDGHEADYFVGPNLADTLGLKMRKIFDRQLALGAHPAAQQYLPGPVVAAQAFVKGWLFYHDVETAAGAHHEVMPAHCKGFWCELSKLDSLNAERYLILSRLRWLAPAKSRMAETLDRNALQDALTRHFANDSIPVLIASVRSDGVDAFETSRGFIVPNDWRKRACERIRRIPSQRQ